MQLVMEMMPGVDAVLESVSRYNVTCTFTTAIQRASYSNVLQRAVVSYL